MANLGLIDFKLGLYIKVNVNDGQNKFYVHYISKRNNPGIFVVVDKGWHFTWDEGLEMYPDIWYADVLWNKR